jgi:hypothetical protein
MEIQPVTGTNKMDKKITQKFITNFLVINQKIECFLFFSFSTCLNFMFIIQKKLCSLS